MNAVSGFNDELGMAVEMQPDGTSVVTLELAPRHLNYEGSVHGGVLSALADVAMARAIRAATPPSKAIMTVDLSISFVGSANTGVLRATGRSLKASRSFAFGRAEISQGERLIAHALGTWYLRERSAA